MKLRRNCRVRSLAALAVFWLLAQSAISRASNTKGCTGFSRSRRCRFAEHFPDFGSRRRACRRAMDAELFQQRPDRHQPASRSGRNLNRKIAFLRA